MAIFEFSSSNGFSSFNLNFECRLIQVQLFKSNHSNITEIDANEISFSYLVVLPTYDLIHQENPSDTLCEERDYEKFTEKFTIPTYCITTFRG